MNGHGGRREGSGRKKLTDKHRAAIEAVESECASHAKSAIFRLLELINPRTVVERKFVPAALLTKKGIATDADGQVVKDDKGKPVPADVRAFPALEDDELVMVEEKRYEPVPDVRAIKELFDRLMGKASQSIELTNEDGTLIEHHILILPSNGRDAKSRDEDGRDPPPAGPAGPIPVEQG